MIASRGGVQGMLGAGDAPATPLTRGGFAQAEATAATEMQMTWRTLVVCDIIPNTLFKADLLVCNEGFVWRLRALHLAIRIDVRSQ
ncbi:MAG TPA: hypothetical protein VEK37_11980 [Gemmatimonadaceae bacterium]|nr:hypothetical protein [Gemmatimonadaceae bacterium]